jgi:hypothetical protein
MAVTFYQFVLSAALLPGSVRPVRGTAQAELVGSIREAAAACHVTPTVVRRWIARGWLPQPPRKLRQIHGVRDLSDLGRRLRESGAAYSSETRRMHGWSWDRCRKAKTDAVVAGDRRGVDKRLPVELPQPLGRRLVAALPPRAQDRLQLLDAIHACMLFGAAVVEPGLASNEVWGFTATGEHWAAASEEALMASGRDDLKLGTNAVCQGWVCSECQAYRCIRDGQTRAGRAGAGSPPSRAGSWNRGRLGCGRCRWSDG